MDPVCLYEPGAVDETNLGRTCVDTRQLKRLIMVPGHAVFVGKNWRDVAEEVGLFWDCEEILCFDLLLFILSHCVYVVLIW